MALPEFVALVIAVAGVPALAYVAACCLWLAVRALVVLLVSVVAIRTTDDKCRKACLDVLDKLPRRDDWQRGLRR